MDSTGSIVFGSPVVSALTELGQFVVPLHGPASSSCFSGLSLALHSSPSEAGSVVRQAPPERFAQASRPLSSSNVRPQPTAYSLQPSSSGIALVMVLGILSVMVIMAVAFAISMRTERVAAGNYADSVRARQLVHVGLARALDDLAGKLGTNGLGSVVGGTNYPPWIVTNSYTINYTNTSTNANMLKLLALNRANEATNFVPRALWAAATNTDYVAASNHWLPIESVVQLGTNPPTTNRMGRVKYLILNCSGLLDANFAGQKIPNRGVGTNPNEIVINTMPEMGVSDTFFDNRATHIRYETQAELAELNKSPVFNGAPSNFTVYSHALPDYWDAPTTTNKPQVNLAGTVTNLTTDPAKKTDIINAFTNCGFLPLEAGILYSNLVDYVDGDAFPSNWTTCVEPAPMINEIAFSSVENPAGSGILENKVSVELWYPFVDRKSDTFDIKFAYTVKALDGIIVPQSFSFLNHAPFDPREIKFFTRTTGGQTTNRPYTFTLTSVEILGTNGMDPLDNIYSYPLPVTISVDQTNSTECIDPRFNAYCNDTNQWVPFTSGCSTGEINMATTKHWADHPGNDTDGGMYVANQPLRSVGELGYLAYGPWKTIKLYGANLHRVLDYFAVGTNTSYSLVTNTIWRGRVNPNAITLDALTAIFNDMPVDNYPDEGINRLVWTNAAAIAAHLQANVQTYGTYTNLADIGRWFTVFPGAADNELKRESIFRNTCGLLSVRQNLFTIIIEAHVASGGNIPRNPVRQRAVALVWRDPYTGEMFVRSIKWLRD